MHISPFAYLFCAHKIVVGHIHTARIADFPVDDHDLTMVAWPDVVHPGEADRVEFVDLDAVFVECLQV